MDYRGIITRGYHVDAGGQHKLQIITSGYLSELGQIVFISSPRKIIFAAEDRTIKMAIDNRTIKTTKDDRSIVVQI